MFTTLQVGRGLAAIAVAMFHLSVLLSDPAMGGSATNPFMKIFGHGYLGVDFFFVLSGFIILYAHTNDIGHIERVTPYLRKRFFRIYPVYWIYLFACSVGMLAIGSANFKLVSLSDWTTAIGLIRLSPVEIPLAQAWTLFHEVIFYGIFLCLVVNRAVGVTIFSLWAVTLLWNYPTSREDTFATIFFGAYNLNFLIGMVAFLISRRATPIVSRALLVFGLVASVATYAFLVVEGSSATQLCLALSFGSVLAGAVGLERCGRLSFPRWLGVIGDASYSIYLLHIHIETYAIRALRSIGINGSTFPITTFVIAISLTLLGGLVAYWLVEKPLLKVISRRKVFANPTPSPTIG